MSIFHRLIIDCPPPYHQLRRGKRKERKREKRKRKERKREKKRKKRRRKRKEKRKETGRVLLSPVITGNPIQTLSTHIPISRSRRDEFNGIFRFTVRCSNLRQIAEKAPKSRCFSLTLSSFFIAFLYSKILKLYTVGKLVI